MHNRKLHWGIAVQISTFQTETLQNIRLKRLRQNAARYFDALKTQFQTMRIYPREKHFRQMRDSPRFQP